MTTFGRRTASPLVSASSPSSAMVPVYGATAPRAVLPFPASASRQDRLAWTGHDLSDGSALVSHASATLARRARKDRRNAFAWTALVLGVIAALIGMSFAAHAAESTFQLVQVDEAGDAFILDTGLSFTDCLAQVDAANLSCEEEAR